MVGWGIRWDGLFLASQQTTDHLSANWLDVITRACRNIHGLAPLADGASACRAPPFPSPRYIHPYSILNKAGAIEGGHLPFILYYYGVFGIESWTDRQPTFGTRLLFHPSELPTK